MTIKILWVSDHSPLPAQVSELKKLFGENTVITQDKNRLSSADEIIKSCKGFDEIVVDAPLSVIAYLTQRGIKPLWAEMRAIRNSFNPDSDIILVGDPPRHMRFQGFKRIKRVALEFEEHILKE